MRDNQGIEVVSPHPRCQVPPPSAFALSSPHSPDTSPAHPPQLTEHLRLVPYQPCHVPKYHDWMADAWLRGEASRAPPPPGPPPRPPPGDSPPPT
jgi:hypothetical protein